MMRILAAPEYGLLILEDDSSGELSIQCLCGGVASWWHRVVLTNEDAAEFRRDELDVKRMMVEICRKWPSVANRLVEPIDLRALKPSESDDD